jgi:hypothetical protein
VLSEGVFKRSCHCRQKNFEGGAKTLLATLLMLNEGEAYLSTQKFHSIFPTRVLVHKFPKNSSETDMKMNKDEESLPKS